MSLLKKVWFKLKSIVWNSCVGFLVLLGLARKEQSAEAFSSNEVASRQWFRHRQFVDFLENQGLLSGNLLDVGCGGQNLLRRLKEAGKFSSLQGCDWIPLSENPNYPGIEYRQVNLNLDGLSSYENKSFDLVVSSEVFEHLENPCFLMREINKKLKENGKFFFSVPNPVNLYERLQLLFTGNSHRYQIEKPNEFGHITLYTKNIVVSIAKRAGFELVKEGSGYFYISGYFLFPSISFSHLFSYSATYYLRKVGDV